MKKRFIFFVLLFSVCIALVIPKTNALTLTESTEQQGGGGYFSVVTPYNKYLMFESNEEVNIDSYQTLVYTDSSNVFKVFEDGSYNLVLCPDGWKDTQDVTHAFAFNDTYVNEQYDIKLMSGDSVTNRFYLELSSIVDISSFNDIFTELFLMFNSPYNDFIYNGDVTIQVKGKPTQNFDGNGFYSFEQTFIEYQSSVFESSVDFYFYEHITHYLDLFEYYGVQFVDFYFEFYMEFEFDLYLSDFDFQIKLDNSVFESSFPYRPTAEMITTIYGGDIVEEIINPDFGSWLTSSLSGFMNFEIVDGWSFGIIFALIVAIPIILYFLKYFFGG